MNENNSKSVCSFNHINFGSCRLDQVTGRNLHWIDAGEGQAVVLVHGGQAWNYTWRHQIEPLVAAGFRVIAPDLPGSGYSDLSNAADYSISALSSFLGVILDAAKVQKAVFVASSAGGLPVLDFTIRFPERVAALVLASPCGVAHDLPVLWKLVKWPIAGELMGLFVNEDMVRSNLQEAFYDRRLVSNEMVSAYLDPLRRKGAWKANLNLERSWNPSFVEEGVQCIDCPTLIIWGANDPWHPVKMAYEFTRQIPSSRVEILPACGHLPHEECPEIFTHLMCTFLKTIRW